MKTFSPVNNWFSAANDLSFIFSLIYSQSYRLVRTNDEILKKKKGRKKKKKKKRAVPTRLLTHAIVLYHQYNILKVSNLYKQSLTNHLNYFSLFSSPLDPQ